MGRDTVKEMFLKGKLCFSMFCNQNFPWSLSESEEKQGFMFSLCWDISPPTEWDLGSVLRNVGNQSQEGHEIRVLPSNIDH